MSKEDKGPKGCDKSFDASSSNVPTLQVRRSATKPAGKPDDQKFWRALQKDDSATAAESVTARSDESVSARSNESVTARPNESVSARSDEPADDVASKKPANRADINKQHQRLQALRSMLAASEARQQHVLQQKLPALSKGVRIGVRSGPYKDRIGTVKDADFIHDRVLLELDNENEATWISFQRLAPIVANKQ